MTISRKHDNSKPMGCSKRIPKREFRDIQFYLKKQEKHQIDNLILHLKQLEKKKKEENAKTSRRK